MIARLSQVLLALILERFSKFSTYLGEVSLICSDAERHLVEFLGELLHQVNEHEIKRARRILSFPELREAEENDAIKSLILAAAHMDILLSETELFPRQRPALEVYDFLDKAFPEALADGWQLAVVLWPIYNFGVEPDLAERLKEKLDWMTERTSKHVVLYLAEIEKNDPTMWGLLAHEMGHALDETKKIADSVFGAEAPAQIEELPRWITELVADAVATKVLGPAYFCAFALVTLMDDNPTQYYSSHPALHKRLEMLKQQLKLMGVLEGMTKDVVDGYYELVMRRIKNEPRFPEDKLIDWDSTIKVIRRAVSREIDEARQFNREGLKKSENLADLLRKGIPISSLLNNKRRSSINEKANQLLHDLKENITGDDRQKRLDEFKERLDKIINDFVEEPTHPIEILNAGWIWRWAEISDWCSKSGNTSDWWQQLQKTDAILKKSIEAIFIHEGLRRNRDDPQ